MPEHIGSSLWEMLKGECVKDTSGKIWMGRKLVRVSKFPAQKEGEPDLISIQGWGDQNVEVQASSLEEAVGNCTEQESI